MFIVNPVKPIHFLMIIVPLLFLATIGVVAYTSFQRSSGTTGIDAAKMQEMRAKL